MVQSRSVNGLATSPSRRVSELLAGSCRREHHALNGQEALIDLPDCDLDSAQTGVHAAHISLQPLQAGVHVVDSAVHVVDPGVNASDLRRKQTRDHESGSDDGAEDRLGVTVHTWSLSRASGGTDVALLDASPDRPIEVSPPHTVGRRRTLHAVLARGKNETRSDPGAPAARVTTRGRRVRET